MGENRRSATFFAIANVLAGLLHYAFQVWSGMQLSAVEFGELNSWMAYLSVALSLSMFAQYFSNFKVAPQSLLTLAAGIGIGASVFAAVLPFLFGDSLGWIPVGCIGLLLAIAFCWFVGQAQIRLLFYLMGTAILVMAASKFVFAFLAFPVSEPNKSLAWAVSLGYAPALAFACGAILLWVKDSPPVPQRSLGQSVWATLILAIASVYIPQFDIIVIHRTQTPEIIGQFARVSILYKAVFFSFLIIAQLILPYQVRAAAGQSVSTKESALYGRVSLMIRLQIMVVSLVLAGIVYGLSDMAIGFVGWDLSEARPWILLSCLNMSLLTNIFFRLQLDCVQGRMKFASLALGMLVAEALIAMYFNWPVGEYYIYALTFNFSLWAIQNFRS